MQSPLYKNASQLWHFVGKFGPFTMDDNTEMKDDQVYILKCNATEDDKEGPRTNIPPSRILKYDPPQVIFTQANAREPQTVSVFRHATLPPFLPLPQVQCQIQELNETFTSNKRGEAYNVKTRNDGDNEEDDWWLIRYIGPMKLPQRKPAPGTVQVLTCDHRGNELVRVTPSQLVLDEHNHSSPQLLFLALEVHKSFPDNVPVPVPVCGFSNIVAGSRPLTKRVADRSGVGAWWMNWLALILAGVVSLFIWKPTVIHKPAPPMSRHARSPQNGNKKQKKHRSSHQSHRPHHKKHSNSKTPEKTAEETQQRHLSLSDYLVQDDDDGDGMDDSHNDNVGAEDDKDERDAATSTANKLGKSTNKRQNTDSATPSASGEHGGWTTVGDDSQTRHNQPKRTSFWTKFVFPKPKNPTKSTMNKRLDAFFTGTANANEKPQEGLTLLPKNPKVVREGSDTKMDNKVVLNITTQKESSCEEKFSLQSEPSTRLPPLDQDNTKTYTFVLYIDGMTCHGCETVVRNSLLKLKGVQEAVVRWSDSTATIVSSMPRLDLVAVVQSLDEVGFGVFLQASPPPTASSTTTTTTPATNTSLAALEQVQEVSAPLDRSAIGPPPGFEQRETSLSLMDKLLVQPTKDSVLRRYRCRCGDEACICSSTPVHSNDPGQDVSLSDLCHRLEQNLGGSPVGSGLRSAGPNRSDTVNATSSLWSHDHSSDSAVRPDSSLEDWIRSSGGGDDEFRNQLAVTPIPCGCGSAVHGASNNENDEQQY